MLKIGDVNFDKKNIIVAVVILLAIGIACWGMFSGGLPNDGGAINQVRTELESARIELESTKRELSESRAIVSGLQQTNSDIAREISKGRELSKADSERLAECQRILKQIRERGKAGDS